MSERAELLALPSKPPDRIVALPEQTVPARTDSSPEGILSLQHRVGNRTLSRRLQNGGGTRVLQRDGPEAPATVAPAPEAQKTDEDLALQIMTTQAAILRAWVSALSTFSDVMKTEADKSAETDFTKVVSDYLSEKLVDAVLEKTGLPGIKEAYEVFTKLGEEAERAQKVSAAGTLRDFLISQRSIAQNFELGVATSTVDFTVKIRNTPEAERPAVRDALLQTLFKLRIRASESSAANLFKQLSEMWIRRAKVRHQPAGAEVIIRLNPDYSVKDAHIQGPGGQKIAEQLVKDSPEGADVYNLRVRRRIVLLNSGGVATAVLRLDANGRNVNEGSFAEGNWSALATYVKSVGRLRTKNVEGDD